jgi:chitin synthase
MGLLSIIFILMAAVGFLTFGFTQAVCGKPPLRYHTGSIDKGSLIINGFDYDFSHFSHPKVDGFFNGQQNPLFTQPYNAGSMDASFLFQTVNINCKGIITPAKDTLIPNENGNLAWYFPCSLFKQDGSSPADKSDYTNATFCHADTRSRQMLQDKAPNGQVFFTWDDVKNPRRNLAVFESYVI